MISTLLFSARVAAAAVLPAVVLFLVASEDRNNDPMSGAWLFLLPIGLVAVVFVGWLDGKVAVAITAASCGLIFAMAAHVEQDNQPLPFCKEVIDYRPCKKDAEPTGGVAAGLWVLVPGGVVALIPAGRRRRAAVTAKLASR